MAKAKKQKPGLGKGLGALLTSVEISEKGFKFKDEAKGSQSENFDLIRIKDVETNPYQPRKKFGKDELEGLKKSIRARGVLVPITVRRKSKGFELISGERRLRSCSELGLKKIPAFILNVESDLEMLELALIENIQREDLNPIEEAYGYQSLIEEFSLTQEDVAERVGKNRATITNTLRLIKLPEIIKESVRDDEIKMGHARALLGIDKKKIMEFAWKEVVSKDLSVRATERLITDIKTGRIRYTDDGVRIKEGKTEILSKEEKIILQDYENTLRQNYGTKVKINARSKEKGSVEFEFYSKEELERLLELFESKGKG